MRVKMFKQPPPAPTASAVGPCPTVIKIVGRPGTGLVGCFGLNGPLRQYSVYIGPSPREREKEKRSDR